MISKTIGMPLENVFTRGRQLAYRFVRAVVKTFTTEVDQSLLAREYRNYQIPSIASSPYVRRMYEAIGFSNGQGENSSSNSVHSPCLILEWLDTDLWHVSSKAFRNNAELPKLICRSVLSALATFGKHGKAHTGL